MNMDKSKISEQVNSIQEDVIAYAKKRTEDEGIGFVMATFMIMFKAWPGAVAATALSSKGMQDFWDENDVQENIGMFEVAKNVYEGYKLMMFKVLDGMIRLHHKNRSISDAEKEKFMAMLKEKAEQVHESSHWDVIKSFQDLWESEDFSKSEFLDFVKLLIS